ncbi:DUF3592 domain-containing protein [Chitinophaga fulva]
MQYLHAKKMLRSSVHVKGQITGFESKEDHDNHTQFVSVVEFEYGNGDRHLVVSDDYFYTKPEVGSFVDVYYEMNNPSNFVIDFGSLLLFKFFLATLPIVIGVILNIAVVYYGMFAVSE